MEYKDFIRSRISSLRNANNISARSLSLDLGMSSEYINQVESGRLNPSLEFIVIFCDHFKISIGEFFDQTVEYPLSLNPLIENLKKLNTEKLDSISNIVKHLVE